GARHEQSARGGVRVCRADELDTLRARTPRRDGTAVTAVSRRSGPFGVRLAATPAEAAADLLMDPAIAGLDACEAVDRVMLFPPSRLRRRRRSATRCGNRARIARCYRRHNPAGTSGT
ncbi:hypothetical protein ABZ760_36235, partial [Streptomyces sp. NPDC006658]